MIKQITVPDLCSTVAEKHVRKGAVRLREGKNNLFNMKNVFALKLDTKAPFSLLLVCFVARSFFFFIFCGERHEKTLVCLFFFFFFLLMAALSSEHPDVWLPDREPGLVSYFPPTHIFFFPPPERAGFLVLAACSSLEGPQQACSIGARFPSTWGTGSAPALYIFLAHPDK